MKKILILSIMMIISIMFVSASYATDIAQFGKSVTRVIKSSDQIGENVVKDYDAAQIKPLGAISGLFKGVLFTGKEAAEGLFDVLFRSNGDAW